MTGAKSQLSLQSERPSRSVRYQVYKGGSLFPTRPLDVDTHTRCGTWLHKNCRMPTCTVLYAPAMHRDHHPPASRVMACRSRLCGKSPQGVTQRDDVEIPSPHTRRRRSIAHFALARPESRSPRHRTTNTSTRIVAGIIRVVYILRTRGLQRPTGLTQPWWPSRTRPHRPA